MIYNIEKIKERFKNTIYSFGFENIEKFSDYVCFGCGWSTMDLYSITVYSDKIEYEYSFARNSRGDKYKIVEGYTDDFYIPKTIKDFNDFLKKV